MEIARSDLVRCKMVEFVWKKGAESSRRRRRHVVAASLELEREREAKDG